MGHWFVPDSGRTRESAYRSRILARTSGNAQSFAPSSKSHLDSTYSPLNTTRSASEPQYPLPCTTLGSNDKQAINDRLAAHKARRSSQPNIRALREKPYLTSEKYLVYRARKRQDAGKDGRPVWPDHVEESFQNALIHIPPMGKRKKTQYGKAYGRNELIREWIYQETGEVRDRKQVSSHIQVLNNFLKEIPEWRSVVVNETEDDEDDDGQPDNGPDYYFESIADQVRLQRELQAQACKNEEDSPLDCLLPTQSLSKVAFEMWVGMPEKITQSLHNYTRISNVKHESAVMPLENHHGWRAQFPDLGSILLSAPDDGFDIVLINSTISLMSDHPPPSSKLGLVLDLDFRDTSRLQGTGGSINCFTSINHMYLNGKKFLKTVHRDCQVTEPGVVKPVFEAEWWAKKLTELALRKKHADSKTSESPGTSASTYTQNFFSGLAIMQEVFASPSAGNDLMSPKRRVAVLLWTFAEANEGCDGITTWQKIIPPPHRHETNSPIPETADVSLPLLGIDSLVDDLLSPDSMAIKSSDQDEHAQLLLSPRLHQSDAYHSGFTPLQPAGEDQLRVFDFSNGTGFTPRPLTFTNVKQEQCDLDVVTEIVPVFEDTQALAQEPDHMAAFFDLQPHAAFERHEQRLPCSYQLSVPSLTAEQSRRHSLANFDISTHQMLQQQLGGFDDDYETQGSQCELDSQHSMIGHINDLDLMGGHLSQTGVDIMTSESGPLDEEQVALEHPSIFHSPKVVRPPLMTHNSFAGVLHVPDPNGSLCFDTPARNEFARLMQGQFGSQGSESILHNDFPVADEFHIPSNIARPRSQPTLPSNDVDSFLEIDLTTPTQGPALQDIKLAEEW